MMKKLIKQLIPACFLFLGVFASCTSESEPDSPAPRSGISLRLQTSAGSTRSSVDTGTEAENRISKIDLWFFASGASDTDKALFCTSESPSSVSGELVLNYTDEVLRLYNMNSEGKYQLFVVANLPADATIDNETTLDELKKYSYSASVRPSSPFCMAGSTNGVHDFSVDSQVNILLLRVASRLDVKIVNATGKSLQVNKVSIVHDQQSVQLFAPTSGTAVPASKPFATAADIYTTSITADEVKCSGYVYENRSATSTDVVIEGSIDGKTTTWTVPIKPDGSTILPRNSICKATINLKGITPVAVTYSIEEWKNVSIDNSLDETYVKLSSNTITLSDFGEGELYIESNADSIKIDLNEAHNMFIVDYSDDNDIFYIYPKSKNNFHIRLGMSKIEEAEYSGMIKITANNLIHQILINKPISSTKFSYTLEHPDGSLLPWYVDNNMKGEVGITFNRSIPVYCKVNRYAKDDVTGELVPYGVEQKANIPYVVGMVDDTYKIPIGGNAERTKQIFCKVEIGLFRLDYGIKVATLTYIIDFCDPSILPPSNP